MSDAYATIYRAMDEAEANIVKEVLLANGISAVVRRNESSMLDGAMVPGQGYWGDVLVPQAEAGHATEVLQSYNKNGETL